MKITTRKNNANHGIAMGLRWPDSVTSVRLFQTDKPINTGTNSNTRIIFSITAVFAAALLTASPAATTCATSWIETPTHKPYLASPTDSSPYNTGNKNIDKVPKMTTVATAIITLCGFALSMGSAAATAAAPQMALPIEINMAWSVSNLNIFLPTQMPTAKIALTITTAIKKP